MVIMGNLIDLTGQRFGRWTVIGRGSDKISTKGGRKITWHCCCDCGNEANVITSNLRTGKSTSCGCARREVCRDRMKKLNTTHGETGTRLFRIWTGIKTRCFDEKDKSYRNYGGRGITMCNEWSSDFSKFMKWALESGYQDELTCDRIDNNRGYFPENCRWITRAQQQRNKRTNRILTFNGESHIVSEWAEITGIPKDRILHRLKDGWTIEKTLTKV